MANSDLFHLHLIQSVSWIKVRTKRIGSSLLFLLAVLIAVSACGAHRVGEISGTVLDEQGSVPGAVVRVQASANSTLTTEDGSFRLVDIPRNEVVIITAWAPGYYIVGEQAEAGDDDLAIRLHPHADSDNPDYEWLPSQYHPGLGENQGCAECHSSASAALDFSLPLDEWLLDAHAQAASNPRFLTMYTGSDLAGNQSPLRRYGSNRDYGTFPLRPDPNQPYYGPGYKLDFPETMGNCAACHTPAASVNNPYGVDPTRVSGVPLEGIPCDFCHKIWDVRLDETTGRPFANMPGVLSFVFRRPPEGHQFFAGPFDDVAPGEDTYSPLQQQSQICAPCHFGVFWDTLIYNSFGEWLDSPYSDAETGQTCQRCHMPPLGNTHFALPQAGGLDRDPGTIFSHLMPGAADKTLLQNAVSMTVDAGFQDEYLFVTVTLTNDKTGHHVPADSPLRQVILLVNATDSAGNPLPQVAGPVVPDWGGTGDPQDEPAQRIANGYYAGVPGTAYAKILVELWTEVSPSGAYWNPTRILSDNRIPAMESDTTTYTFEIPVGSSPPAILVDVKLLYRRAFIDLMDQKGWEVPDILMEETQVELTDAG